MDFARGTLYNENQRHSALWRKAHHLARVGRIHQDAGTHNDCVCVAIWKPPGSAARVLGPDAQQSALGPGAHQDRAQCVAMCIRTHPHDTQPKVCVFVLLD